MLVLNLVYVILMSVMAAVKDSSQTHACDSYLCGDHRVEFISQSHASDQSGS